MKLEEILRKHGVDSKSEGRHTRAGWLQMDCPFCQGSPYLGYNLADKYFNCWKCGFIPPVRALIALTKLSYSEIKKHLGEIAPEREIETKQRGKLVLPKGLGPLQKPHIRYLEGRGYDVEELVRLWDLRGIGKSSKMKWRVWIPIYYRSEIVSFTTRSISDNVETRYCSAAADEEILNHKDLLYGEDYCRHAAIVHEGPADVWRTGPGAVCSFGTGFKPAQIVRIARFRVRVVCYDSQPDAQRRAKKLCDELESFPGDTWNVQLDSKDAGCAHPREIRKLRKFLL